MIADPVLFIKRGCPHCSAAAAFFSSHGVPVRIRDVSSSRADMKRLIQVSEEGGGPTFVCGDSVVSGFDIEELLDELAERPDIRMRLGLGDLDDEL